MEIRASEKSHQSGLNDYYCAGTGTSKLKRYKMNREEDV